MMKPTEIAILLLGAIILGALAGWKLKPIPEPTNVYVGTFDSGPIVRKQYQERVVLLQDSVDWLKIKLTESEKKYQKIRRENEKIRIDVARMSNDELLDVLTKRYKQ